MATSSKQHCRAFNAGFSHEALFRDIVHGTYHPMNVYHQILPGQSLRVASVLRKHGVDADDVINVVQPRSNAASAICGDIDIDNIDSVHRMAALIGLDEGRANMNRILRHASVTDTGQLAFDSGALEAISVWSDLRATLYSLMIGHPDCVAYNAYVHDLVRLAVDNNLIAPNEWYLSDRQFEERLLQHERTRDFAGQLLHGCRYTLVDYVWLRTADDPQWRDSANNLRAHLPEPPVPGTRYFVWFERGKIERAKTILVTGAGRQRLGQSSASLLVALVSPGPGHKSATDDFVRHEREAWRSTVVARADQIAPGLDFRIAFPEDFVPGRIQLRERTIQHALF